MTGNTLKNPGDVLEGRGALLQHGRLIAKVDYHLALPTQTHFFINPTGKLQTDYKDHAAGFILLTPDDAAKVALADYTLEFADKTKLNIKVERQYKQIKHNGLPHISFWVNVIQGD